MEWNQKVNIDVAGEKERNASGDLEVPFKFARSFNQDSMIKKEKELSEKNSNNKIERFLDGIIKFSIIAIFFGLPLFFTNLTFQGIAFEKQIYFYFWLLLALVAWGSKSGYMGEFRIRRTPLDIPIIGFWFFYLINTIFSIDRWHSFVGFFGDPSRGFISITAMIVLYYIILSNFTGNLLKWMVRTFIFSGIIAIFWEILKFFDLKLFFSDATWASMPISTIGSLQSAAVFACFLIFILMTAVLKIQSDEKNPPVKRNIYAALISFSILLTFVVILVLYNYIPIFKGFPLAGLVIGSAFFLIFVLAKIVKPRGIWTLLPMVVFIVVLVFLMIGQSNIAKINLPFNVSVPYKTSLEIAKGGLKDNFFLGYGPGNYGYAFSKYLPQNFDNMNLRFFQGEGLFLESLSTIGSVGTVLLMIIVLTFLGASIFLLYREKEKNKIYSLGLMSATLVLLINALVSQIEAPMLILLVMSGTLTTGALLLESDLKDKFISFSLKTSPKFALTLAFISLLIFASVAFLFVFFGKIYLADIYMGSSVRSNNISEDGSISKMAKAINLNNREGRYYTRLGQEYLVLTNNEMLKGEEERDVNKIQIYLSNGVQAGLKGEELMKKDVTAVETLAQIYENSGLYLIEGLDMAEKEYRKSLELEPNNPNFYVRLGQIKTKLAASKEKPEEKKKLVEEARDLFQKSIDIRNNLDSGYYNLALAQEALGQLDQAIENMTKAVGIRRDNINYVFNLGRLFQSRGKGEDNKIAESLFKQILGVNDKEINTNFNLGLLYEKTDRKSEAVEKYKKVIDLLPGGSDSTKEQLEKMISNIQKGIENTPENLGLVKNQEPQESSQEGNEEQTEQVPAQ